MSASSRPSPRVRLLVSSWPADAPRGAVRAFCEEHGVSTSWFYKIRAIAVREGQVRAIEPRSTRPLVSPKRTADSWVLLAVRIRQQLLEGGLDHGPLSVLAKLRRMGFVDPPSRATLARVFHQAGLVAPEPRKKPRSAFRSFVYPAPNCLWQIDSTAWTLADGSGCVIFQLIDDHSRLSLASLVARAETADGALQVVRAAIDRHGIPQKFLSDNGVAFNPIRRGYTSKLVDHLASLGVETITGKPYKPTTQGKNERFHRTLHRFLNARPPAATMLELQALVDEFDRYYNTEREHQRLPDRSTPHEAWTRTPTADPPRNPSLLTALATTNTPTPAPGDATRTVSHDGRIHILGIGFRIGKAHAGTTIHIIWDERTIEFFDDHGTQILTHNHPPTGTKNLGNGRPRGFMNTKVSTKS